MKIYVIIYRYHSINQVLLSNIGFLNNQDAIGYCNTKNDEFFDTRHYFYKEIEVD